MLDTISTSPLFRNLCYINGEWVPALSGETLNVENPATGAVVGTIASAGGAETQAAIDAAEAAMVAWRKTTADHRSAVLERWFDLIIENRDELARIMTIEQGKPLAEAKGEVNYGAAFVKWFAEEARRVYGETVPAPAEDGRILVQKMPIGVVAAITPWNFPLAMVTRKVAPALAAGCTIVLKPSEITPYSALALAVLAEQAGVPKGCFNIVTGEAAKIGAVMTASPVVRKLTFTGSTRVGKLLMEQSAGTVKRMGLELGGNAPFIVFDDADIDLAIAGAMGSKFRNGGQACVASNRMLVQDGIYDLFAERLKEAVAKLKVGNGLEADSTLGPMVNAASIAKISAHVAEATDKGAKVLTGGEVISGLFYAPTILTDVTEDMLVFTDETFGPVAPLVRFKTEEEAIAMANSTPYGLSAFFYSQNLNRAFRVGEALEFGMVGINAGSVSVAAAPFGGIKESGAGREGSHHGIDDYLELKALHFGGVR